VQEGLAELLLTCNDVLPVQLPPDIPAECPFEAEWHAAVCTVQAAEGLNLPAIKEAFKQLKVLQQLSLADLAARLEPGDPLVTELAAAEAANAAAGAAASGEPPRCVGSFLCSDMFEQRCLG
jgi:hypothetical protein